MRQCDPREARRNGEMPRCKHGPTEARAYIAAFLRFFAPHEDRTVALFPPALSLTTVRDARADRTDILLGVQNIYSQEKGAFTGENSAPMARDAGAQLALVGHSERRHVFGETDAECARKTVIAAKFGLIPVLCVGETLAQREKGNAERVVVEQLQAVFDEIQPDADTQIVIAYEPVWAIGTGRSATPADAAGMHAVIRAKLSEHQRMNPDRIPILYGGSVNRGNAKSLLD